MAIDWVTLPTHFVPFDEQSPDWEVAERVFQKIVGYMHDNQDFFRVSTLIAELMPGLWDKIHPSKQGELTRKAHRILTEAARHEFRGVIKRVTGKRRGLPTHADAWEILHNPLAAGHSRRTGAWKKLQKLTRQFIEALRTGTRQGDQLTFEDEGME